MWRELVKYDNRTHHTRVSRRTVQRTTFLPIRRATANKTHTKNTDYVCAVPNRAHSIISSIFVDRISSNTKLGAMEVVACARAVRVYRWSASSRPFARHGCECACVWMRASPCHISVANEGAFHHWLRLGNMKWMFYWCPWPLHCIVALSILVYRQNKSHNYLAITLLTEGGGSAERLQKTAIHLHELLK